MATDSIGGVGPALIAILGIWSLVGLGFFIWYLAALARLFPKLGLPGWAGWVPVWNEWQLFQRAGLPGWTAIANVIPGLNIVALVMRIIAIHRINTETGQRVGLTVLGAIIPPLWATLLGSELDTPPAPYAAQGAASPSQGAGRRTGSAAPYAPQAGHAPQQGYAPAPAQQSVPGQQHAPAQQGFAQPGYAQPGFAQPAPAMQNGEPQSVPAQQQPGQAPQSASPQRQAPAQQYPAPAQQPTPEQQPAEWRGLPPVPPQYTQQQAQYPVQQQGQQQGQHQGQHQGHPGHPAPPAGVPAQQDSEWGLGLTTEREFERLASEDLLRPPAASLAPQAAPQPFAWPEEQGQPVVAPPLHPAAARPRPSQTPPVDPVPATAPSADSAPVAPQVSAAPATAVLPVAAERVAEPAPAPVAAQPAAAGGAQHADDEEEDVSDRTIVVPRKPRVRWSFELPDGQRLEILGSDVIVGRKPQAVGEATTLLIPDTTRTLSKSHARMRLVDGDWTIEDLGSTNGLTLIQEDGTGEQVKPGQQLEVTERMVIGTLEVRLLREEE